MSDNKDEVLLLVNGTEYAGWKEVEIVAGIERVAREFTLSVTSKWPGATDIPRRISQGDKCEVFIGLDLLLTGHVDATPIRYDARNISVGVKGRSLTADLVDSSAVYKTGQWKNAKIEKIAADLAGPFGIEIVVEAATGAPLIAHAINPGESAFECFDRLLTANQMLATDDAKGRVVFIRTGSGGAASTALEYGKNILSADSSLDGKDVFAEYIVNGQRAGTNTDNGEPACSAHATVKNSAIKRYRPLMISQSGQVTTKMCSSRAYFEMMHRAAKALETDYTVQGWRQGDGSLWLPNQTVRVTDPVIGLNGEFLIVEVAYRKGDSGTTTTLKVGLESGYIPAPEVSKTKNDVWKDARSAK
jgi:prophage tail gpP-like protein